MSRSAEADSDSDQTDLPCSTFAADLQDTPPAASGRVD